MEARNSRGIERVHAKLQACLNSGNYYEAHQMYRTLYFRYLSQKKYTMLLELLKTGANILFDHGQQSSGADLSILFVQVLKQAQTEPTDSHYNIITCLFSRMGQDMPERETFINEALRWSLTAVGNSKVHKTGHPVLHRYIAQIYWREKNYLMARHHYLHSTDGIGCATMLVEQHRVKGYANEVDLFIAQAVLQYLCLQNTNTAVVAFKSYTSQHPSIKSGPPYLLPLLNFIYFLLQAIDNDGELVVFTVLCERYQPSIQRDPSYPEYLGKIARVFFGAPEYQPRSNGLFGNIFQSIFDESDSEDGATSSAASHTRMRTEDVD